MGGENDKHTIISIIPETVKAAATAYFQVCKTARHKINTIRVYRRCIDDLVQYLNSQQITRVADITPGHLREYFLQLNERHNVGGVEVYYRPIHAMFRWYWDEYELDSRNPINRVKVKHAKIKPRPGIPLDDVERMLETCNGYNKLRDLSVIMGLLDTCCRATEFCKLRLCDVDFVTGQVRVVDGKGDKTRMVRLGNRTLRALRRYLKTRHSLSPTEPLIATRSGGSFDRFSLRLLIDRRADDAGIPHYGLHDFRRRGAYELWKRTRDLKSVSAYLGHSTADVTERYLDIDDDDVMDAHVTGGVVDNL